MLRAPFSDWTYAAGAGRYLGDGISAAAAAVGGCHDNCVVGCRVAIIIRPAPKWSLV